MGKCYTHAIVLYTQRRSKLSLLRRFLYAFSKILLTC